MYSRKTIQRMFAGHTQSAMRHGTDMAGYKQGCINFLKEFHDDCGVCLNEELKPDVLVNNLGMPYKAPGSARPSEFSIREMADAIIGTEVVSEYYHPSNGFDFSSPLREAAIDPTTFLNINVFNIAVAGLINAQIMERFDNPAYVGRNLVEIYPTKMNGHKRIAVARLQPLTKAQKSRLPGDTHPEFGFTEMYQTVPENYEQAGKIVVTKEVITFDLTQQVLQSAGEVSDELAYGMEKEISDTILGVLGLPSRYNFNGNTYESFQASSPFANDFSNPFSDITSIDSARQKFVGMTDPVTGREINVNSYQILCMPARELIMRQQLFGPNIQIGTQQSAGNFPTFYTNSANQINTVGRGTYSLFPLTAIWYNRALAVDGLNLSAAAAQLYWFIGDFQKAFQWTEVYPMTTWMASADEYVMKDRGLVAVYGANYRGAMFVKEPRYVVRCKN